MQTALLVFAQAPGVDLIKRSISGLAVVLESRDCQLCTRTACCSVANAIAVVRNLFQRWKLNSISKTVSMEDVNDTYCSQSPKIGVFSNSPNEIA